MSHDHALAGLANQAYLTLEYRTPRGRARAPLPFVAEGGLLYTQTALDLGGHHWLQATPPVRVTGAEAAWLDGRARLAWEAEAERAEALLRRKYGRLRWWLLRLRDRLRGRETAVVAVHVETRYGASRHGASLQTLRRYCPGESTTRGCQAGE